MLVRPQTVAAVSTAVTLLVIPALGGGVGAGRPLPALPSVRSLGQQRATAYQALLVGDHSAASRPQHAVVRAAAAR